jgi:hypothetical protein
VPPEPAPVPPEPAPVPPEPAPVPPEPAPVPPVAPPLPFVPPLPPAPDVPQAAARRRRQSALGRKPESAELGRPERPHAPVISLGCAQGIPDVLPRFQRPGRGTRWPPTPIFMMSEDRCFQQQHRRPSQQRRTLAWPQHFIRGHPAGQQESPSGLATPLRACLRTCGAADESDNFGRSVSSPSSPAFSPTFSKFSHLFQLVSNFAPADSLPQLAPWKGLVQGLVECAITNAVNS